MKEKGCGVGKNANFISRQIRINLFVFQSHETKFKYMFEELKQFLFMLDKYRHELTVQSKFVIFAYRFLIKYANCILINCKKENDFSYICLFEIQ